jgi:dihydrofolate reductase
MKVILVFVSTLDGKVTKWGEPVVKAWTSQNDKEYFREIWDSSKLIIMGANTYRVDYFKPSQQHFYVVMTHNPSRYEKLQVEGQLEFTNQSPSQLVRRFEKENYGRIMVVGGAQVATSFFKENMIDEVWLTIEPKIFGSGGNFVTNEKFDINLRLLSYEKVNEQGTLITKYEVIK